MGSLSRYGSPWFVLLVLLAINTLVDNSNVSLDLTEEGRYTLTEATKTLLGNQDEPIYVEVLLEGDFPAEFERLQRATKELLDRFRNINPNIIYQFNDPLEGDPEDVQAYLGQLAQVGIRPTELSVRSRDGEVKKQVYPIAIFNYADRQVAINLLEEASAKSSEETLNQAISLLEYKCANAIAKLRADERPNILFVEGHGELDPSETAALENNLNAFYNTGRIHLDSVYAIPNSIDLLIIAKPRAPFSQKELFVLDQYIVRGGRAMFLIDQLVVNLDSIQQRGQYIPRDLDLNLDDLLFKYGCRIQKDLVLDLECSSIPLVSGGTRENPQFKLFNWYYHPLVMGNENHPISKGLKRINLLFPSSIDTIKTKTEIKKTVLLQSSTYTRVQQNPVMLDFNILRQEPDEDRFAQPPHSLAVLLEGRFPSLFENRVSNSMQQMLDSIGSSFSPLGEKGRLLVVSDGDIARNTYDVRSGAIRPLGYNQYMKYTFGNGDFLFNAIEYLLDRNGLIQARSRHIQLRLLDRQRLEDEKTYWQALNLGLPILLLLLGAFVFSWLRKKRYAHV